MGVSDGWLSWLDADTTAPAWPTVLKQPPGKWQEKFLPEAAPTMGILAANCAHSETGRKTKLAIAAACHALIQAEPELTELDRVTGDGDLGASMERAAKAVLATIDFYPVDNSPAALQALAHTLRHQLGGSSGPLYGILFLRCASVLERAGGAIGIAQWAEAIRQGCDAIGELGGAKPGDRTMLDALVPFAHALNEGIMAAVVAAEHGVEATAQMKPRAGRSSYLGDRVLGHPDPGAKAVSIWLRAAIRGAEELGLP
jgi:dihydroxyacetone kinase